MTRPKGVRVTVRRGGYCATIRGAIVCWSELRRTGVPPLRPGESVTGRMVFVPDKKKGAK